MPGIDRFLSQSLEIILKKSVDQKTEYKMKRLMFEKYGISIRQSVESIDKLLEIRKNILGEFDYSELKIIMRKICRIKKASDGKSYILEILDKSLKESMMKKLGDDELREIFTIMMGKSHSNSEVLKLLSISTTSGYRKMNMLIHDGFLLKSKSKIITNRRLIDKHVAFCDKVLFELQHDKLILNIHVNKKYIESSSIFNILEPF